MPNMQWSRLTGMQLGRYAEYYAKMEFTSYGFEVYTSEVDDHGVDFVIKKPKTSEFYEVQVKSIRNTGYIYMIQDKMELSDHRLVCVLRFEENHLPEVYVIPATEWKCPNALLVDRQYGKEGQSSKPEWGINISKKNLELLNQYAAEKYLAQKMR